MLGNRQVNARAYVARFNFTGADQEKKCGMLSGGERNRLHLALALKEEGNVLLLDEPTNDIDVNTLRALEEGLENFAGCAVVISHDRWFLDRIATHILSFLPGTEISRRSNADRDALLQSMEGEFTRSAFLLQAEATGIKPGTASTWLKRPRVKHGMIESVDGKGTYRKPLPNGV